MEKTDCRCDQEGDHPCCRSQCVQKELASASSTSCLWNDQLRRSGERWKENCEECECVVGVKSSHSQEAQASPRPCLQLLQNGQVDCWRLECPPCQTFPQQLCLQDFQASPTSSCCPSCLDLSRNQLASSLTCQEMGILRQDGEVWPSSASNCTHCQCKVNMCNFFVTSGYVSYLLMLANLRFFVPMFPRCTRRMYYVHT